MEQPLVTESLAQLCKRGFSSRPVGSEGNAISIPGLLDLHTDRDALNGQALARLVSMSRDFPWAAEFPALDEDIKEALHHRLVSILHSSRPPLQSLRELVGQSVRLQQGRLLVDCIRRYDTATVVWKDTNAGIELDIAVPYRSSFDPAFKLGVADDMPMQWRVHRSFGNKDIVRLCNLVEAISTYHHEPLPELVQTMRAQAKIWSKEDHGKAA